MECQHESTMYLEPDSPVILWKDGSVKYIIYKCGKCGKAIYRKHPWENWQLAVDSEIQEIKT